MNNLLVSIIITTKNSAEFLEECLKSIKNQSYQDIEIIVVDNNSTDDTKEIAKQYTNQVFNKGPERSAQRNFGVRQAKGDYVLIIDSDMKLSENVIASCAEKIKSDDKIKGIIIPEESFGVGFWAKCKKLERSFYVGVDWMEAARFFDKNIYEKAGGFDENITGGEDWDLSQRVEKFGKIDRISDFIYHNEGNLNFYNIIKKRYYYAKRFKNYAAKQENNKKTKMQISIIKRYKLFFSNPKKLFKNPILGLGMVFMKSCEFGFGGIGYLVGRINFSD
ncbi:MAG: glycosyltransferase [Candidatus Pacebacteria bacterium]|nr:glycosyltransferase [Candidatus Paceibacterota bacterium]